MGYVDRVAVKVWPDTRGFERDMKRTTEKRRKTLIEAVLDAKEARAELAKLENSRTVMDLEVRTEKAKAKLADLHRQMADQDARKIEVTADVRQAKDSIAALNAEMTQLSSREANAKAAIKVDVESAMGEVARLRAELAAVTANETKAKVSITGNIKQAQAQITKLRAEMASIDGKSATAKAKITADISEAKQRIAQLRKDLAAATSKEARVTIRADIKQAQTRITKLRADMAKVVGRKADNKARVTADIKQAQARIAELRSDLATVNQTEVKARINASIKAARDQVEELRKQLKAVDDKDTKARISADIDQAQKRIKALTTEMATIRDKKVEIQADTAKARKELDRLEKDRKVVVQAQVDSLNARRELIMLARRRVAEIWVRVNTTAAMANIRKVLAGISGMNLLQKWGQRLTRVFENLPQTVIRIATLGSALAALVLPAMSALSALAPIGASLNKIGPIVLAAVPLFGALAAQVTVLAMAFTGLAKTSSQSAKKFKKSLDGVTKEFGKIRTAVQEAFFSSGFTKSFTNLTDQLLPKLKVGLTEVATQVGLVGAAMMDAFGQSLGDGRLDRFFDNLTAAIHAGIPGVRDFTTALTNIGTTGSEVFPDMARWINEIGARFRSWSETADIEGMLRGAAEQFGFLWQATKNLGSVIAGIFRAMDTGKATGLESFAETLGKIREIVWSPAFQTAMRTIFTGAAAGAAALSAALGPIGRAFERLAPLIAEIFSTFGGTAASALTGIMDALAQPVAQDGIKAALEGIAEMVKNVPWDALGLALGAIGRAIGLIAPLVTTLLTALAPLLPPIIDAIASLIPPITQVVIALLPAFVAIIQALIPIVAALAPVIQSLVPIIQALAPVISIIANVLAAVLVPAFQAVGWIIENVVAPLISGLLTIFTTAVAGFTALINGDWSTAWNKAQEIIRIVTGGIKGFFLGLLTKVVELVGGMASRTLTAIAGWAISMGAKASLMWRDLVTKASAGIAEVIRWIGTLPTKAVAALGNIGSTLANAGKAIINGFWSGAKQVWANVKSWIGGLASWIASHKGPLSYDYALLQPAGKAIMSGFHDALALGMKDVERLVNTFAPSVSANVTGGATGPTDSALDRTSVAVTVENMNVRNDSDIRRIAQGIADLTDAKGRASGNLALGVSG